MESPTTKELGRNNPQFKDPQRLNGIGENFGPTKIGEEPGKIWKELAFRKLIKG